MLQGLGGGALIWSVAVQWVPRPWVFLVWCKPRSAPTCVLPVATLHELYSSLKWLLLVLGLEIPMQSCESRLAATSAGPGAT